jgi:V8-like Glu-specific endopeptidase
MNGTIRAGVRRNWWCVPAAALALSGCGSATSNEGDAQAVGEERSELKNGSLYDGNTAWRGVVLIGIWNSRFSSWDYCSGQVVSAQTILTAGHCVKMISQTTNPSAAYVAAWRQGSANSLVTVMPTTWAMMRYNPAFNGDAPFDVGLIIAPSVEPLQNVTSSDAGVLAKTTPSNVNMFTFGFGYYGNGANDYDFLGRYGTVTPVYASRALYYFFENTGTRPEICAGDSGAPLKSTSPGSQLVYGIVSRRSGGSGVCQPIGTWTTTAHNLNWLRGMITGSCVETSTSYSCW